MWLLSLAYPLRADTNPDVVISQVHGDFIEIFNRSGHSVSIAGWSVQYTYGGADRVAPATWNAIGISGSLAPGQYYLVEVDGSNDLQADATGYFPMRFAYGGSGLNFEGTIALVRSATPLTVVWPSIRDVADLFGYGQGVTADGSPFPGQPTGSFTFGPQAALRLHGGCVENHNNATDFQLSAPAPRNTRSPAAACPTTPTVRMNGVVNSASFAAGAVAPGEFLSIFGANLGPTQGVGTQLTPNGTHVTTNLGGVRVLFDGAAAPMIYASAGQVNVVAPFALAGKSQTTVQVEYNGVQSSGQTLPVVQSAPGIFTSLGTGVGQAAALNQDSTANNDFFPDPQGSVVVIYAMGAGQTSPAGEDGLITGSSPPKPVLPVTVTIGGHNANVVYAGNAPGLVSGVLQVNAQIPPGLTGRQDVILKIGNALSQSEVTIAVDLGATAPSNYFQVNVPATDIAYDAGTHRLYASIGNDGSAHANSVAVIDPSSGNILNWIPAATGPARLALSDDGHYLYVASHNSNFDSIQRLDVRTGLPDFTVNLAEIYADYLLNSGEYVLQVTDMQVLPGQPRSVALAVSGGEQTAPAVIIDDSVRRPAIGPPAGSLTAQGAGLLWGNERAYFVSPEGLSAGPLYPVNVDTMPIAVSPAGNVLIAATGLVMNSAGSDLVAELAAQLNTSWPSFVYRPDTGLAYFAGGVSGYSNILLEAFDPRTYMPCGQFFQYDSQVPPGQRFYGLPERLLSVGPAGLATIGAQQVGRRIFIFPLSIIRPLPPVTVPSPLSSNAGIRRFTIPSNSMAVNPAGDRLYLSVPSVAPPIGNSILPFDVKAGAFGSPVWVGSEPDLATVSSDGQHLHVVLAGARTLARLSLPDLTVEKAFHITQEDGTLTDVTMALSLPSAANSVILGRMMPDDSDADGAADLAIYDDGVQRPNEAGYLRGQGVYVEAAQVSADGSTLYGESSNAALSRWAITPQGFQLDSVGPGFAYMTYPDLSCQGTLCLEGDSGYVVSTANLQFLTQLGGYVDGSLALMDSDNNRMFRLTYSGADTHIERYDATSYKLTGLYVISHFGFAHSFKMIVDNQLAIANGDELILLPISMF